MNKVKIIAPSAVFGAYVEGCLQGKNFRFPTDRAVAVDRAIARIVEESLQAQQGSRKRYELYTHCKGCKL